MATVTLRRFLTKCLPLVALLAASSTFAAGTVRTALRAVRVPSADLEFLIKVDQGRKAPFYKAVKALQKDMEKDMNAEALAASKELEKLLKALGIEEDSVTAIFGAVSLRSMETKGQNPRIPALLAIALKAPLDAAAVRQSIIETAAKEGEEVDLMATNYKDVPMLSAKIDPADLGGDMPRNADKILADIYVAFAANGQVLYLGQSEQVKAAIDRMLADESVPRTDGLTSAKDLVQDGADGYVIFDMPDAYRQFLDQQAANAGGNPMAVGPLLALAGLKGASLSSVSTDKVKVALTGSFEAAANAVQLKTISDMGLGFVKMQLVNPAGQPMALANSLQTKADGDKFSLTFEVTVQDVRDMIALGKSMQQGGMMGAPGRGGMGGAPAPVPAP